MSAVELELLLRTLDLAAFGLSRLPARDADREATLTRLTDMIRRGEVPTEEDYRSVLEAIDALANQRDNIVAMKPEESA